MLSVHLQTLPGSLSEGQESQTILQFALTHVNPSLEGVLLLWVGASIGLVCPVCLSLCSASKSVCGKCK